MRDRGLGGVSTAPKGVGVSLLPWGWQCQPQGFALLVNLEVETVDGPEAWCWWVYKLTPRHSSHDPLLGCLGVCGTIWYLSVSQDLFLDFPLNQGITEVAVMKIASFHFFNLLTAC